MHPNMASIAGQFVMSGNDNRIAFSIFGVDTILFQDVPHIYESIQFHVSVLCICTEP